jgi:hypothetical protein
MARYPTIQLEKAYESLKDKLSGEVVFGSKKEHKLVKEYYSFNSTKDKGVTYSYYHYNTLCIQIDLFVTGGKVPFMFGAYSPTDRDNINGLFKLLEINDYKAKMINGRLVIRRNR